jgi:hypothetical protein
MYFLIQKEKQAKQGEESKRGKHALKIQCFFVKGTGHGS